MNDLIAGYYACDSVWAVARDQQLKGTSLADRMEVHRIILGAWERLWWAYLPFIQPEVVWEDTDTVIMFKLATLMITLGEHREEFQPEAHKRLDFREDLQIQFVTYVLHKSLRFVGLTDSYSL